MGNTDGKPVPVYLKTRQILYTEGRVNERKEMIFHWLTPDSSVDGINLSKFNDTGHRSILHETKKGALKWRFRIYPIGSCVVANVVLCTQSEKLMQSYEENKHLSIKEIVPSGWKLYDGVYNKRAFQVAGAGLSWDVPLDFKSLGIDISTIGEKFNLEKRDNI